MQAALAETALRARQAQTALRPLALAVETAEQPLVAKWAVSVNMAAVEVVVLQELGKVAAAVAGPPELFTMVPPCSSSLVAVAAVVAIREPEQAAPEAQDAQ